MFFRNRTQIKASKTRTGKSSDKNKEAFKLGYSIAKLITSSWNSQEKPRKVYIFNRRVHHGGVGTLLGLSNLFRKSQPVPAGILSGLGDGLAKDDYADRDSWFNFDKKPNDNDNSSASQTSLSFSVSSTITDSLNTDVSTDNEMYQGSINAKIIKKAKESSPNQKVDGNEKTNHIEF
jgi:hypothetical protein